MLERAGYERPSIVTISRRSPLLFNRPYDQSLRYLYACYQDVGLVLQVLRAKIRRLTLMVYESSLHCELVFYQYDRSVKARELSQYRVQLLHLDRLAHRLLWEAQSESVRAERMPWFFAFSLRSYSRLASSPFRSLFLFMRNYDDMLWRIAVADSILVCIESIRWRERNPLLNLLDSEQALPLIRSLTNSRAGSFHASEWILYTQECCPPLQYATTYHHNYA
jgi:hypothetical protein